MGSCYAIPFELFDLVADSEIAEILNPIDWRGWMDRLKERQMHSWIHTS